VETLGPLSSILFDPAGLKIFGVGPWANLTIWNTVTGEMTTIPDSRAHTVTMSANSEFVATGDELGQIRILALPRLTWVANIRQGSPVSAIAFTPDGKGLVASSRGIVLRAWRFTGDRLEEDKTMHDTRYEVLKQARQSGAGLETLAKTILFIGGARQAQIAGAPTPTTSAALFGDGKNGQYSMRWGSGPCPMRLSSDGTRLAIASCLPDAAGYDVQVWDVANNRRMDIYKNSGPAHGLSPDGNRVAIGVGDKLIIRDVTTDASHNLTPP
jgi:WD40 repeat protein